MHMHTHACASCDQQNVSINSQFEGIMLRAWQHCNDDAVMRLYTGKTYERHLLYSIELSSYHMQIYA